MLKFAAAWLALEKPAVQDRFLADLTEGERLALPYLFEFWAHPHQLAPDGAWRAWLILGGRGAGKTRAGAEWVRREVEGAMPLTRGRAARVALIGETYEQTRDVMVFGDSGILACCPPDRRPKWEAGRRRLVWPNGATATVFSASDPGARIVVVKSSALIETIGASQIGQTRHFRVGPSRKSYSDQTYTPLAYSVTGVGLRPLSPVHMRLEKQEEGVVLSWIRQTRIGGDRWDLEEVPLSEEREAYRVEAYVDGRSLWSQNVDVPSFIYSNTQFLEDGSPQSIEFRVAQISAEYGPGLYLSKSFRFA